jgi:hypothetical protein
MKMFDLAMYGIGCERVTRRTSVKRSFSCLFVNFDLMIVYDLDGKYKLRNTGGSAWQMQIGDDKTLWVSVNSQENEAIEKAYSKWLHRQLDTAIKEIPIETSEVVYNRALAGIKKGKVLRHR